MMWSQSDTSGIMAAPQNRGGTARPRLRRLEFTPGRHWRPWGDLNICATCAIRPESVELRHLPSSMAREVEKQSVPSSRPSCLTGFPDSGRHGGFGLRMP